MGDPLWTVIAFAVIIFAALAANIHKKIGSAYERPDTTKQKNYDIDALSVLNTIRDGNIDSSIEETKPTTQRDYSDGTEKELTRALVWWTFALAMATAIAAIFAGFTLDAIRGQLGEMRVDNRAWASADIEIADSFIFDPVNPTVELTFHYKNTGKSPAMGVNGLLDAIAIFDGTKAAVSRLKAVCDNVGSNSALGVPLLPGDSIQGSQSTGISVSGEPTLRRIFNPIILTCIGYKLVGDNDPHFTARSFRLSMKAPRPGRGCCAILADDGPVGKSDLKLEIWQMKDGNFAN